MSSPVVFAGLALAELHRRARDARTTTELDSDLDDEDASEGDECDGEENRSLDVEANDRRWTSNDGRDDENANGECECERTMASATSAGDSSAIDARRATTTTTNGTNDEEEKICRFCFTGRESGSLIAPCACDGSQRFVHRACLRRWQRVSFETRGAFETRCRVCDEKYEVKMLTKGSTVRFWFSLRAKDRLNEYSRAWARAAMNAVLRRKGVSIPRSASSAGNLALLVASTEVNIWARREEHRSGSALPKFLRVASFLLSAASVAAKVKLLVGASGVANAGRA